MSNLIRNEDLVNNPTPRVPICLCVDTSGSMGRIVGGEIQATGNQIFRDGQMWDIVTGGISAIDELNDGIKTFYEELRDDETARYSAEICVVTFGGTAPKLIVDFASLEHQEKIPILGANGDTPMGEAVNLALDCLERRKKEYQDKGVDYYQPWLVLMTDGAPNGSEDELNRAISRTVNLINSKKLTIFPIGIGTAADMVTLGKFSPKRTPLRLKDTKFNVFFQWLSKSVSRVSASIPGQSVPLESTQGWSEV